ncbi:hypothetical protein H4687_005838 [Streptomyces stelliscabiei]|uniref:Uncharacterized protein n=1 Tax=Streptomyces stelliscabiei TaxID=146820 RepID=A0A8I0P9R6_9ACTN|nr:hypothetical protein [Streptomyces stelliscabiei]
MPGTRPTRTRPGEVSRSRVGPRYTRRAGANHLTHTPQRTPMTHHVLNTPHRHPRHAHRPLTSA